MGKSLKKIKQNLARQAEQLNLPAETKLWSGQLFVSADSSLVEINKITAGIRDFSKLSAQGLKVKYLFEVSSYYQSQIATALAFGSFRNKIDLQQQSKSINDVVIIIPPRRKVKLVFDNLVGQAGGNLFFVAQSGSEVEIVENEVGVGFGSVFVIAGKESRIDYFFAKHTSQRGYYQADLKQGSTVNFYSSVKPKDFFHLTVVISHWQNFSQGNIRSIFQASGISKSVVNLINYHYGKNTKGDIIFRGVGKGKAWSRVNGFIIIDKRAFVTDSYLQEDLLLLSDQVNVKAEPNLEILNNDVRASHGATLGTVDDSQLYYLRSRGLTKRQAEKIIEKGFLRSVADSINSDLIKTYFIDQLK